MTSRRVSLPCAIGLALATFALDQRYSLGSVAAVGYVLALLLSLWSASAWDGIVTALVAAGLALTHAVFGTRSSLLPALISQAPLIVILLAIALSSIARLRSMIALTLHTEARHRNALERLAVATRSARVSVWEWDFATDRLSALEGSPLRERLGGREWINGREYLKTFIHPDDAAHSESVLGKVIAAPPGGDDRINLRYRWVLPDGGVRHIEVHAVVQRDASGKPVRSIGADRDVTEELAAASELERHAAQLRDAESRLERATRSSLEGHWEIDLVKRMRWHSSSFQALLGHPAAQLQGTLESAAEQTHPDDVHVGAEAFERHMASGSPLDYFQRLRIADGSFRWFRMRGRAERDASGMPVRIAGSVQDVHEQKLAEDALLEAQQRFERAVQGTQDGLWEIDLTGPKPRYWRSPRMLEIMGYADEELTSERSVITDNMHPEDLQRSHDLLREYLARGVAIDHEVRIKVKSGEYRWFRMRGSPACDESGRVRRASGSIQDVTESRSAREALLRATAAAEAASRAKSAFLATMSHEIRTPMNGIIGMTDLLLDTVLGRVQREYAQAIRASSQSLLTIINDILDFSKIEAGKLEIESVDMDLRANVEEVGAMLALGAATKGLELVVDVDEQIPVLMRSDPQRIRQCLLNLVGNAVKFTARGEVVLRAQLSRDAAGAPCVRLEVRDSGIGIDPEARAALFQPFTQADSSTTRKFGGSGLGLSIVKRLVELMGGEVGVESTLGTGSTFWFTLPLVSSAAYPPTAVPVPRAPAPVPAILARRALVVDDHPLARGVLVRQLAACGLIADSAADAEAALTMLRAAAATRPYELVLIDQQMPGVTGAELGELIGSDPMLARTRLVLLVCVDQKGDPARFAEQGFAACLTRPVRSGELRDCVAHVCAAQGEDWDARTFPEIPAATPSKASAPQRVGGRVLVVEDNVVNQKVAEKFLERFGCTVRVAGDGAQALEICAREDFDLILMDMQMPVMDGPSATRQLRMREGTGGRTPIVALTANVLSAQMQSCLDAGMDDVLAKPLDPNQLRAVLERFVGGDPREAAGARGERLELSEAPIDLARLASLAGDDSAFMRELVATFKSSSAAVLAEMRSASGVGDRARLTRAAHKLRGASENLGAGRLRELTLLMESAAPDATRMQLAQWIEAIAGELAEVDRFFATADLATILPRRAS